MKGLSKTPPPPPEPCLKEGPTPQLLREPRRAQPTCSPREWVAGWRGGGAGADSTAGAPAPLRPGLGRLSRQRSRTQLRIAGVAAGRVAASRRSSLCPGPWSAAATGRSCRRGASALPGAPAPSRGGPGPWGGAENRELRSRASEVTAWPCASRCSSPGFDPYGLSCGVMSFYLRDHV